MGPWPATPDDATKPHIDRERFTEWFDSTDHLYHCAGYSEGMECCLGMTRVLRLLDDMIIVP